MVRNFAEHEGSELLWVCDLSSERLEPLRRRYPGVGLTTRLDEVLADRRVDAVCIATPSATHFELARRVLLSGRHALVEKPLCDSSERAQELTDLAARQGKVLMVDHTFLYHPAVRCIRSILDSGRLGQLLYFDSTRVNLGLFQRDVNVLWDLAVHDLAIMDYLLPQHRVQAVSATGMNHLPGQPANIAYMTCFFANSVVGHIHANWLAPVKLRRLLLCGEKEMVVYDDLDPSERVKVYDKGITAEQDREQLMISYRSGDCWCPRIPPGEALANEVSHFLECIDQNRTPLSDGAAGVRVVRLIEAASRSLERRGEPVEVL